MPDLVCNVKPLENVPAGILIQPEGFIDTNTAPDVQKIIEDTLKKKIVNIVIDLEKVDFISSAGWGIFVSEIRDIRDSDGDLVLVNMLPDVFDVYELMEFSFILKSFDSIPDAVAYFKGKKKK